VRVRDSRRYLHREPKDFANQDLRGRSFDGRYLFDADFRCAELADASFVRSMLEGARFDRCALANASFREAHLAHVRIRDADLRNADLGHDRDRRDHRVTANYCDMSRSILDGADLSRLRATHGRFEDASFRGAVLDRAVLVAVVLTGAVMGDATLRFTDLSRARLEGADLRGADLSFANLSGANLTAALHDESTVWRGTRYNQRTRWFDGERRRAPLYKAEQDTPAVEAAPTPLQ